MPENNSSASTRKIITKTGVVVSDKMDKTIVVRIDTVARHLSYGKVVRRSSKVKTHDEKNVAKVGNFVKIIQTRPISKDKRWKLGEILKK